MKTSQEIIDFVEDLDYTQYRKLIKVFQGTGNSEGNLREKPLASALTKSKKFKVAGTQYKVLLSGLKRKVHRVDILLENKECVIAVNCKSNGKSNTLSDHSMVPDYTAYVNGLKKLFPNKKITYVLARNSDIKHGLIPELQALGVVEWSWEELLHHTETPANTNEMEVAIMEMALAKLNTNVSRWF